MEPAQDRKSPNVHFVSAEEAAKWKTFEPEKKFVDPNANFRTVIEGQALSGEVFDVNNKLYVIFKKEADWGSLRDIQKNDIAVVKSGERELLRMRYIEPGGAPGEVFLEFRVLGPEGLR